MKERIRFSHVDIQTEEYGVLSDFSLSIFEGEAVFLTGMHGSGKSNLIALLLGEARLEGGAVYVDEKKQKSFDKEHAYQSGIRYLHDLRSLIAPLTVGENLFGLKEPARAHFFYPVRAIQRETENILTEAGLTCSPDDKIYSLREIEKYLLGILKASLEGTRVLVLNMRGMAGGYEEYRKLAEMIKKQKERGMAFLIIADLPDPLLDICDRAVVVRKGRVAKMLMPGEIREDVLLEYMSDAWSEPADPEQMTAKSQARPVSGQVEALMRTMRISGGELMGLYPRTTDGSQALGLCRKLMESGKSLRLSDVDSTGSCCPVSVSQMIFIPRNSGDMLLDQVSLKENLLYPVYPKLSGAFGRVKEQVGDYLVREFLDRFDIAGEPEQVGRLRAVERRLLSICRYEPLNPKVVVVEEPDFGMDLEGKQRMNRYLQELSSRGTLVFLLSGNPQTLLNRCSLLIVLGEEEVAAVHGKEELRNLPLEQIVRPTGVKESMI